MRRRLLLSALCASLCLTLGGCWSANEIQSVNYAKAIGLDYKDGLYHIYIQSLDFASVAKTDASGQANEEPGVWVGHGQGKTLHQAINDLFRASQMEFAWGHVTAIVLSESVLDNAVLTEVIDMVVRFPESRYTAWIYATRTPIDKLFTLSSLFNLSPLDSILHNPVPSYHEESLFPPIQSMALISNQYEQAAAAYLPSIAFNDEFWTRNNKPHDLYYIEGAFYKRKEGAYGYMPRSRLFGFTLMQRRTRRVPLLLDKDGEIAATISIGWPKIKITPVVRGDEVRYRIKADYTGAMFEYLSPMEYEATAKLAEEKVKGYIMSTYRDALKQRIDVYRLEERLYRTNPAAWKRLTRNGKVLPIDERSIEQLDVKVKVIYNGRYKRITRG